ncbi:hypothetical protein HNQ50_000329 [Silvimonas terrae]|uniref:Uncharacterized protein n=1 Tax=Silvimonas terrae TaxID=300266 RepID=A0A840R8E8_9NEIS|nr:hypothetical protein [Silvimonas terrae]
MFRHGKLGPREHRGSPTLCAAPPCPCQPSFGSGCRWTGHLRGQAHSYENVEISGSTNHVGAAPAQAGYDLCRVQPQDRRSGNNALQQEEAIRRTWGIRGFTSMRPVADESGRRKGGIWTGNRPSRPDEEVPVHLEPGSQCGGNDEQDCEREVKPGQFNSSQTLPDTPRTAEMKKAPNQSGLFSIMREGDSNPGDRI